MHARVTRLLKQHTAATHERVEHSLALGDGNLTRARVRTVLARFAGFWPDLEHSIDRWADAEPGLAVDLQWPRRRRSATLRRDLRRLGMNADELRVLPAAPRVFAEVGTAEAFGWLYVAEGSTLGGAVIDRSWRAVPDAVDINTFTPYAEGPGPMWRDYHRCLDGWVGNDAVREQAVVAAAATSFDALEQWVRPISRAAAHEQGGLEAAR